ncbi:hypothetical protein niasHS_005200 [Heterodera schachtii]|uniref:Uncharacterized protein n=1 Tax=Heterodera schachtii TaxID=97005 RepID=A0ABD2JY20_HETSC
MHTLPKCFPTTIIVLLTVWRCGVVDSIGVNTVNKMIKMTFLITGQNNQPPLDKKSADELVRCYGSFLQKRILIDLKEFREDFVEPIVKVGFTKVHEFLNNEFKRKPNAFWNSLEKSIDEISSSFESEVMPEILKTINNDKNGKQKTKQLSSSSNYEKQLQQEFVILEKKQSLEEKPLREELKDQAERVGAALLYTLIHMKMRLLFERNQVKNQISISNTSAKATSQMRGFYKRMEETVVKPVMKRINSANSSKNSASSDGRDDDNDKEKPSTSGNNQKNNGNDKGGIDIKVYLEFWVKKVEEAFRSRFNQEKDQFLEALDKIPCRKFVNVKKCVEEWENMVYLM